MSELRRVSRRRRIGLPATEGGDRTLVEMLDGSSSWRQGDAMEEGLRPGVIRGKGGVQVGVWRWCVTPWKGELRGR